MCCPCIKICCVDKFEICSINCFKTIYIIWMFPLYLLFFSYLSVMCTRLNEPTALLIFLFLLVITLDTFIHCIRFRVFINENNINIENARLIV